ncbi:collagen alpha-4(VI) chain-like [Talpa occidentalis]|uniref:collagen alpha-4(VI) chain-like n=1 Tax=Talpa occidentalis TaxID=50954 RepID=UPI0023F7B420|nr:collagen alpha-4(VI) chain-like [Talpa occidentalis]
METWKIFWSISFLAASFGFITSQRIVCREASVGDVVFLVHTNIRTPYVHYMRKFLSNLVGGLNVSREAIHVGLVLYNDIPHSEFLLSTYHHKNEIMKHIQKLQFKPGGNKMGLALQFLLSSHFQEKNGSRAGQGVPQIAVVISSQASEDPVQEPVEALRRAGILLYAVGIKDAASKELREIANSPPEKFTSFIPNFPALTRLAPALLLELCATLAKAAQPVDHVSPACKEAVLADIVFLVDSSTSIGPQNFQKVKNFLHSVVLGLDISSDQVRVGLVQYNDNIYPAFQLDQYPQKNVVLEQIQNLPYRTGGTNTGSALEFVRTNYLTEAAGSRAKDRIPQIVILVTDGESSDEVQEAAESLKEDGVFVYVVGINVQDVQELQKIASEPFEKFLFNTKNFNILQGFSGGILQTLCSTVEGRIKEFTKAYADVVFLADTSQGTSQTSFQRMQTFISRVIGLLDVGRNKYQIGLAQYGGQGHAEFLLNTYQTKDEMIAHIQEHFLLRGGPRRTGKALRYLHQTFFQEAAGSRFLLGTPQYAVVLTSGRSVDEVQDAAQTLREKGVRVMSVGVQDFDRQELEEMGSPSLVYEMHGQDGVRQMMQDVSEMIQGTGKPETRTAPEQEALVACLIAIPTDLVFLIEEFSRARQSNFQQVVNFLKTTVSSLRIHPDVVRMGLVFYSEEPHLEFSLDTFQNANKILEHLDKLTYRGRRGKTKTGAALDFLRKRVFIQEKGSRHGVQQMAVVITDSSSHDNVSRSASLLRKAGVTIYVVGTQLASDNKDLEKIASYPPWKHVTQLESFLQLSIVERTIKNQLCPEITGRGASVSRTDHALQEGCVHVEKADIYFLIDGSGSIYPDNFLEMKSFMYEMIKMFQVGPDRVQFGVVQYSEGVRIEFFLDQYSSVAGLKGALDGIQQKGGGTMTGGALHTMAQVFTGTARQDVPWYLIVITDGKSSDPVAKAAEALRGGRVSIYAIGIRNANTTELKEIADDKVYFVYEFDSLKFIHKEVVQDICFSETCKTRKADIIFLIDGSESISPKDFEKMKEFMKRMVNLSNIGPDEIQIGLLQFSTNPQEEFRLNKYSFKVDIHEAISNVQQLNDGTRTGKALNFTLPFFDSSRGGRPSIHQYLIVITDGVAQDNVALPAKALRDRNIIIFALGVGKAQNSQLLEITNDQSRVYYEEKFESLQNLEKEIFYRVCIPQGCDIDLSLGIDLSTPTRQVQQMLQRLLPEVVQHLDIVYNVCCIVSGEVNPKFRYLVPDSNDQIIFDSGFEKYSEEIIQKFLANQFAKSNYMDVEFLKSLGESALQFSAAKVKVLIVFTDGLDDNLERLKETSAFLRSRGLSALLLIGLEGVTKLEELQELEFGRGFTYNQPLSSTLPSLPSILRKQVDTVAERTCCNMLAKCFGEDGYRGLVGSLGRKGKKGFNGLPGHPGEEGGHGERGPQGLPGLQGEEGCPGMRGPKGVRGFSGEKGDPGEEGLDGLNGEQGSRGVPGSLGEKGNTGNRGLAGPPGQPGEYGEPGLRGDPGNPGVDSYIPGPKGEKGRRGLQGRSSFDGLQGKAGDVGPQGSRGRRGQLGLKGIRGESGGQGHDGEHGHPGSQGLRGRQGPPGIFGQKGLLGAQGNPGFPGPNGSKGKAGPRGMKGEVGDPGRKGSQGRQGPRGQPGALGPDGYGRPGRKGTKGGLGFPGYPGAQGEVGDPGRQGEKGAKGLRGTRGNAGFPGFVGTPGDQGLSGPMGVKGPKGVTDMTPCEIVEFTRKNCPVSKCPVFPTEVVFALDMSNGISQVDFERMKNIVLSLVMKMEISESNCPTGARVAIVSYSTKTDYLIRFSDYKGKPALLQAIETIPLARSSGIRNLGGTMKFMARHLFKRVRSGLLMRKVAVFFQAGWAYDADAINTAILELSALDIHSTIITFTQGHNLPDALLMDGTNRFHLFIWETEHRQDVELMARCALCYDKCRPAPECGLAGPRPLELDVDLVFLVDASHSVGTDVYHTALSLAATVLEDLQVAAQPRESFHGARVALVTHTTPGFLPGTGRPPVRENFHLTTYNHRTQIQRHILEAAGQTLQGSPALGHALEWTLEKVLLAAPLPRRIQVLFVIVASETSVWDREMLRTLSLEAKCKGITLFVLALGPGVGTHELAELAHMASAPSEQHFLRLEGTSDAEMTYARGFIRAFMNLLKSETNQYPPPELTDECGGPSRGDTRLRPLLALKRSAQSRLDIPGSADDLKTLETTDLVPEEKRESTTDLEIFEMNRYDAEENECGMSKQRDIGKERNSSTAGGPCSMDPMEGECQEYILKWYYNKGQQACQQFWYGSCGGNANRFETKEDCEAQCVPVPL